MTMRRALYSVLVALHPPAFRKRFGPEMMATFEEAAASSGNCWLLFDGAISAGRQWIIRESVWKVPAAVLGGIATILFGVRMPHHARSALPTAVDTRTEAFFLVSAAACLLAIAFTIVLCVVWFRLSTRRRQS